MVVVDTRNFFYFRLHTPFSIISLPRHSFKYSFMSISFYQSHSIFNFTSLSLQRFIFFLLHLHMILAVSGIFGREDVITHVHTQMINWHGASGTVFSVDIQPFKGGKKRRVATGGSDSHVQVRLVTLFCKC